MPQTKSERKYFQVRVDEKLQNTASIIDKKLTVAKFQPVNKIIAGGAE